jgi:hypothetical protein
MKREHPLFDDRTLEQAPLGYRFMRSFPLEEVQKLEEPLPASYSRKHSSRLYPVHYSYKPISRFRVLELYKH